MKYIYCLIIMFVISVLNISALELESLNNSIEEMIIRECAKMPKRHEKIISLAYIRDIVENEYTKKERIYIVFETIEYLAFEGTVNPPKNLIYKELSFPDVRLEAVKLLGLLKIIEARNAIFKILKYEHDPFVIHEAIRILYLNWNDFYDNKEELIIIKNALDNIIKYN